MTKGTEGEVRFGAGAPLPRSGTVTVTPAAWPAPIPGQIIFNALSTASVTSLTTVAFSHSTLTCQAVGGPVRCLAVQISPGGQSRLCDTAVTAAGDNRKCN